MPEATKRLLVADSSADRVEVVDTEASNVSTTIDTPASFAGNQRGAVYTQDFGVTW